MRNKECRLGSRVGYVSGQASYLSFVDDPSLAAPVAAAEPREITHDRCGVTSPHCQSTLLFFRARLNVQFSSPTHDMPVSQDQDPDPEHHDQAEIEQKERPSFLSLAPDTRNIIYDIIYTRHNRTNHTVTISSERGYREVPADITRVCRQLRHETLSLFFDLRLVIFVVRTRSDLLACRGWLSFVPDSAWPLIRGVRVKHTHRRASEMGECNLNFELGLDNVEAPVTYWADRRPDCGSCCGGRDRDDCVPIVDLVLKDMCAQDCISHDGVSMVLDLLEPFTT